MVLLHLSEMSTIFVIPFNKYNKKDKRRKNDNKRQDRDTS